MVPTEEEQISSLRSDYKATSFALVGVLRYAEDDKKRTQQEILKPSKAIIGYKITLLLMDKPCQL